SRRRHTRSKRDWSSDVCSSDLIFCDFAVSIHAAFSVCGICHIRVLQNVVLQIHYRKLATDKQNSVPVIEHSHFIRGKQFTTGDQIGRASCRERERMRESQEKRS